jgi:hypothetical protein
MKNILQYIYLQYYLLINVFILELYAIIPNLNFFEPSINNFGNKFLYELHTGI